jgi:ABC-type multidrug transport system ATPase subunit
MQEDTFIPTMTCVETLAFNAAVKLSGGGQQRGQQVQEVLREMGLGSSSDTLVRIMG